MDILNSFAKNYDYIINQRGDPRVKEWFLMDSPWPVLTCTVVYLYVVLHLGPRIMAQRQPYTFHKTLIAMNVLQIVLNSWVAKELIHTEVNSNYHLFCHPIDYSANPTAIRVARALWVYLLLKVLDLSDTLFMTLRKKFNQMSFLHIFHHTTTLALSWGIVKYGAGGVVLFGIVFNSLIHIVMYGYYLLAALGPRFQPYLWWKKYLTSLQIVQLSTIAVYHLFNLIAGCNYPKPLMLLFLPIITVNLIQFYLFYRKSYIAKKKKEYLHQS